MDTYHQDTKKTKPKRDKEEPGPRKIGRENQDQIKEDHSCVDNEGQTVVIVEIQS